MEECLLSGVGFAIWARRTKRAAEAKASKVAVHYRDYPKGMQMCHMCKFYLAEGGGRSVGMCMGGSMGMMGAGACQVVEGRMSPMGWRDLYAPV